MAQPFKEALRLGLDHFRWQMTYAETSARLSALAPRIRPSAGSPLSNQPADYFGPHRWRDCFFNISVYFTTAAERKPTSVLWKRR